MQVLFIVLATILSCMVGAGCLGLFGGNPATNLGIAVGVLFGAALALLWDLALVGKP